MDTVRKLRELFDKKTKKKFTGIFAMMVVAALLETLGIGLIVPFVGIITNPSTVTDNPVLSTVYYTLGFESTNAFLILATITLIGVFILKNAYLVWFHYLQYKVIFNEQVTTSKRLLNAYLKLPYTYHLQKNSAELVRNTNTEVQRMFRQVMVPSMLILTEMLVVVSILCLLLVMAPIPTIISGAVLGGSVGLFFRIFRRKLSSAAQALQSAQGQMIKWVNQGLGAGKEVKVSGREQFFVDSYTEESTYFANATRFHELMKKVPRFFIETIVVTAILSMVLIIMIQSNNLTTLLSTMSLFAMAAFRLMPSLNRMTSAMTTVKQGKPALDVVHNDLIIEKVEDKVEQETMVEVVNENKSFTSSIDVNNVSFWYPGMTEAAIQDVSLSIPIGQSVAFVGPSGSGKTTMTDIMLGVLPPDEGTITVDGQNIPTIYPTWQRNIGYIPQFIYLSDDTIRRNVAFGRNKEEIEEDEVWRALTQAHLKDFVHSLPEGIDTFVGERGVRLSGGQRQRIGIARALYHDPEILFLDEATSALDNETEKEIMKAIDGLKGEKTLIIIAHRLTTIEKCDFVYKMEQGSATYKLNEKMVT